MRYMLYIQPRDKPKTPFRLHDTSNYLAHITWIKYHLDNFKFTSVLIDTTTGVEASDAELKAYQAERHKYSRLGVAHD